MPAVTFSNAAPWARNVGACRAICSAVSVNVTFHVPSDCFFSLIASSGVGATAIDAVSPVTVTGDVRASDAMSGIVVSAAATSGSEPNLPDTAVLNGWNGAIIADSDSINWSCGGTNSAGDLGLSVALAGGASVKGTPAARAAAGSRGGGGGVAGV